MKFRYDINALRAIALLGVILFHYHVPYFSGGFAGVDVFFVISGYLMTRIIINGLDHHTFSFSTFYSNRLKRIIPALLFLTPVLLAICFFIYFPKDFSHTLTNAAASIVFLSNIWYWHQSNYFNPSSDTNLFLHTWSLSVEWQFYLIYPVILLALHKIIKKRYVFTILFMVTTLLIMLLAVYYTHRNQTGAFYALPTRSWEMLFGGIAFLLEGYAQRIKFKKVIAVVSYIIIIICFLFLNNGMYWPGGYTVLPVFFTFLVILLNINDFKILRQSSVQFAGRISYSLYLWHWPVLVLARNIGAPLNALTITVCIIIAIAMAYISYKYVESGQWGSGKLLIMGSLLFIICTGLSFFNPNKIIFNPQTLTIAAYGEGHIAERKAQFNEGSCFIVASEQTGLDDFDKNRCLALAPHKKNILLIGDSHAAQISTSLKTTLAKRNINLIQATASGCLPIINSAGKQGCVDIINYLYNGFIINNANKLDGVIISANWIDLNGEKQDKLFKDLNSTIKYLEQYKLKTVIIGQSETYTIPYPFIAAREFQYHLNLDGHYINEDSYEMNQALKQRFKAYYVEIYNYKAIHDLTNKHILYMFDNTHFTKYGADLTTVKILANPLLQQLLEGK